MMRSTKHATFTIDRIYTTAPARVFAAWANKDAKAAWFFCHPEWLPSEHIFDFRAGGREHVVTGPAGGTRHVFDAHYYDVVTDQRIVFAYEMHLDDRRISVSLATIEFFATAGGTRLVVTEQGVFLDGYDDVAGREEGTRIGLGNLDDYLGKNG
jgi:uncharacterized protein YndB with AHSA1/START domain